jgi:hypothetical protein
MPRIAILASRPSGGRPTFAMCARAQTREGLLALMFACRFGKRKGVFPCSPAPLFPFAPPPFAAG